MKDKVVVGIPVYNGENHISEIINSLLNQSYKNIEVVVVDNASSDKTVDIVRSITLDNEERLKLFVNNKNIGMVRNFNKAFEICKNRGKYFMWASHDDYYDVSFIEKCLEVFEREPSVGLVSTFCSSIKNGQEEHVDTGLTTLGMRPLKRFSLYREVLHKYGYSGTLFYGLYKVSSLQKVRKMEEIIAGDHIPLAELSLMVDFYTIPEKLFFKRMGGASRSLKHLGKVLNITNKFELTFPFLNREIVIQKMIWGCLSLGILDKVQASLKSLYVHIKYTVLMEPYYRVKHQVKMILIK